MGKRLAGREATDRQRIDAIVAILKKSVFTDDESEAIAALDELADATDSISLDKSEYLFNGISGTLTLVASTDPSGKTVEWSSSNSSVATVNNGVVTPIGEGTTTITATSGDKTAACAITVQSFQVDSITLNQNSLTSNGELVGTTHQLTATTSPAGGTVSWSSGDESVATVSNTGLVTIVGNGTATITASCGNKSATCSVAVSNMLHKFHISVGTLSNVALTDGNGNAIADGTVINEGSQLTLVLTPASSHEIGTASVTMGGASQTLTDGQNGTKTLTIQSVSGDIAVSASAVYVAKDYAANASELEKFGVKPAGALGTQNEIITSKIFELDFGKTYLLSGYDWNENGHNGASNGYNFALCKSDGNGGYTSIASSDVTRPSDMGVDAMSYSGSNVCRVTQSSGQYGDSNLIFTVLPKSAFTGIDKIYMCVNVQWGLSGYACTNFKVTEFLPIPSSDMNHKSVTYVPQGPFISTNENKSIRIFSVEGGKSYSYAGYGADGVSDRTAYMVGLVASIDGVLRSVNQSEVSGLDAFFTNSSYSNTYATRLGAPQSGGFTVPNVADINAGGTISHLFVVFNTRWDSDFDMTNFTFTENS